MNAASQWIPIHRAPKPGRDYLIAAKYGGIPTFDVAFYNGLRRDGSHWWTLGNIEIDPSTIEYYALINYPEKWERDIPS